MKKIFCSGCSTHVASIEEGSKIINGAVMLCDRCDTKRIASDLAAKTNNDPFRDFSDLFKRSPFK